METYNQPSCATSQLKRNNLIELEEKLLAAEQHFHQMKNTFDEDYLSLSLYEETYYEVHFDEKYCDSVFIKTAKDPLRFTTSKQEMRILCDNNAMKNKNFKRFWKLGNSKFEIFKLWPRRFRYSIPNINPSLIFTDLIRVLSNVTREVNFIKFVFDCKKLVSILAACSQSNHAFFAQCNIVGRKVTTQIKGRSKLQTLRLLKRGNMYDYMCEPTYVDKFLHCVSICPCQTTLKSILLENLRLNTQDSINLKSKYGFDNAEIRIRNLS
ncbi:unnamed protein product [Moneuplotes crassus]|uniref:Uncharacterized protein n=1 Tax=Euplotes crassus TaxID=5936 RepID=A0AAD1XUL0_EUPCR|nr:unnamed protein product [Moneuplotes crassus]